MDARPFLDAFARQAALPQILRAIRRYRGLRSSEVARAMGMPLRSYQHFESGAGRLDVPRIHRFAEAVDADSWAILLGMAFGSVDFPLRCIENKAASIFVMQIYQFNARCGPRLTRLDPRSLILALGSAFDVLEARAKDYDAYIESWMLDPSYRGPVSEASTELHEEASARPSARPPDFKEGD